MALFDGKPKFKGGWIRDHSLSIFLIALLLAQSVLYHFLEWPQFVSDQQAHGQPVLSSDYWTHYWAEWMVSVLADTYGAVLLVLASKWFFERGSAESKDKDPQQNGE